MNKYTYMCIDIPLVCVEYHDVVEHIALPTSIDGV